MAAIDGIHEIRPGRKVRLLATRVLRPALKVLFVHGAAASMVQYEDQFNALAGRGDTNLLAWDWLGCGGSEKPQVWSAYSPAELRADVEAALALLCADSGSMSVPVMIIAHSYGCSLVCELLAAKAHLQPAVLVLMSTSDGSEVMAKLGVFALPVLALQLLQPMLTDSFVRAAFHPDADEKVASRGREISAANDMHMCRAFYRQMRWATPDVAAAVHCPVLAVHGESDMVISIKSGREWHAHFRGGPHAFAAVPVASHMVMMERARAISFLLNAVADDLIAKRPALGNVRPGRLLTPMGYISSG